MVVWPQWWSFVDMSQQGLHFSKKISRIKIFFDLPLQMFTWVVKKCLNLTFKVIFLCQKSFESFWFFFQWQISFVKKIFWCFNFWTPLLQKWWSIFDELSVDEFKNLVISCNYSWFLAKNLAFYLAPRQCSR